MEPIVDSAQAGLTKLRKAADPDDDLLAVGVPIDHVHDNLRDAAHFPSRFVGPDRPVFSIAANLVSALPGLLRSIGCCGFHERR